MVRTIFGKAYFTCWQGNVECVTGLRMHPYFTNRTARGLVNGRGGGGWLGAIIGIRTKTAFFLWVDV